MNLYDKTQDEFRAYAPERSSVKHFHLTMVLVGLLLVLLLGLLAILLIHPDSFIHRAGIYTLFGIAAVFSVYLLFFAASEKSILRTPKAFHDYQFCLYKNNRPESSGELLIKMSQADIVDGQLGQALSALRLVQEGKLKSRQKQQYQEALSAAESGAANTAYTAVLIKHAKRKIRLFYVLQGIIILIFLISVVSVIALLLLPISG